MSDSIKQEFDNKIDRLTKSAAYLDFCEEVYGYRLYLFNMMDKEQLDYIFNEIPLSCNDTVLDIGCGSGSILNTIAEKYNCSGIGADQLVSSAVAFENKKIQYLNIDFDNIEKMNLHPSVTLLVDSIYFSHDSERLLGYLSGIKNNRIYLFYSQYLFGENISDRTQLQGDFTLVADILKKAGISYKAIEYSENEKKLYEKSLQVLKEKKEEFFKEGNADLYEEKINEQLMGKRLYDNGNAGRYLYIIGC